MIHGIKPSFSWPLSFLVDWTGSATDVLIADDAVRLCVVNRPHWDGLKKPALQIETARREGTILTDRNEAAAGKVQPPTRTMC